MSELSDFTIATWINLSSVSDWVRIFDFGTGTNVNMFLTPSDGTSGLLRFAITTGGGAAEQQINSTFAFPTGVWTHVAVTLHRGVGVLYVDGVEVGRNNTMTLNPSSLGNTTQNYIGKSQYADPYFDGRVDDFRILNLALTAADVMAMANLPDLFGDYNRNNAVDAADYTVWRDALGTSVPAYSGADGDGDGFIGEDDFGVWRGHFGETLELGGGEGSIYQESESADISNPPAAERESISAAEPVPEAAARLAAGHEPEEMVRPLVVASTELTQPWPSHLDAGLALFVAEPPRRTFTPSVVPTRPCSPQHVDNELLLLARAAVEPKSQAPPPIGPHAKSSKQSHQEKETEPEPMLAMVFADWP